MSFGSLKRRAPTASSHAAEFALGAEGHQDLALGVELQDGVRANVGGPDVAVLIDADPVAAREQAVSESTNEFAVLIELGEWLGAAAQDV